jgi:hypothetical protein
VVHLFTTASRAREVFQNQSPFLGVVFDLPYFGAPIRYESQQSIRARLKSKSM